MLPKTFLLHIEQPIVRLKSGKQLDAQKDWIERKTNLNVWEETILIAIIKLWQPS